MRKSWLEIPADSDFSLMNIPFGIFKTHQKSPSMATRLGNTVVDIAVLAEAGYFADFNVDVKLFRTGSLNDYISLGKNVTNRFRQRLMDLFSEEDTTLKNDKTTQVKAFHPIEEVVLLLPVEIGDYTDFYSSREHATNVGTMFRDPANALLPNWLHLPVAYHGRASSIVVSGTPIRRPKGQTMPAGATEPVFGACKLLDFELEMAFIIGKNTEMGTSVSTTEAENYIFGMVIFNDWSARDIQTWEYQPLGPFLSKNFASSISPWVVCLEALEPFRMKSPTIEKPLLPYLQYEGDKNFDIDLEVWLQAKDSNEATKITHSNFKYLYWNMSQQLAHHTVNGCNIRVGDMCASGTISGSSKDSYGSMLELTWRGANPIKLVDGGERKFIQDGDTITMKAYSVKEGLRVGFGEVIGSVLA
jgi:fumarylacetoacetase